MHLGLPAGPDLPGPGHCIRRGAGLDLDGCPHCAGSNGRRRQISMLPGCCAASPDLCFAKVQSRSFPPTAVQHAGSIGKRCLLHAVFQDCPAGQKSFVRKQRTGREVFLPCRCAVLFSVLRLVWGRRHPSLTPCMSGKPGPQAVLSPLVTAKITLGDTLLLLWPYF